MIVRIQHPCGLFVYILEFAPVYTVFTVAMFFFLCLYTSAWRFVSFSELNRIVLGTGVSTVFHIIGIILFVHKMPLSYNAYDAVAQFCFVAAIRFKYRCITLAGKKRKMNNPDVHNAMIISTGATGQVILKELKTPDDAITRPLYVSDDNPIKWKRFMEGIPIVGGRENILEAVH